MEQDADYNVTSLTDASGNVVERYSYDPYGNVTVLNANGTTRGDGTAGSSEVNEDYLYQGMRYSTSAGTYATETRVYSPTLGRPLTEDPARYINGMNMGQWEMSNPVAELDSSGMQAAPAPPPAEPEPDEPENPDDPDWVELPDGTTVPSWKLSAAQIEQIEINKAEEQATTDKLDPLNVELDKLEREEAKIKGEPDPTKEPHLRPRNAKDLEDAIDAEKKELDRLRAEKAGKKEEGSCPTKAAEKGVNPLAEDAADYAKANNGAARPGYNGGGVFKNKGQVLPSTDAAGNPITYKEYDINPYQAGTNRGTERVVIGSDGSRYFTDDHYQTFKKF